MNILMFTMILKMRLKRGALSSSALILGLSDEDILVKEMGRIHAIEEDEKKEPNRFTCEVVFSNITGRVSKIYFYAENI